MRRDGTTSMDIGKAFSLRSYSDTRLRDYNVTQSQSSFSKMPGLTESWAVLDVAEKEPMVKALRRSSIKLGFAKPNFNSTSRIDFRPFTQAEQGASQGAMDPAAKADLRAVHYRLGEDGPSRVNYVWYESELDRCAKSHWDPTRKVQVPSGQLGEASRNHRRPEPDDYKERSGEGQGDKEVTGKPARKGESVISDVRLGSKGASATCGSPGRRGGVAASPGVANDTLQANRKNTAQLSCRSCCNALTQPKVRPT
ncbi:unnamed protein product [Symbiodinium sp. CCMP2456]|nr:unnamed protein product [Symbiodinium sp. CCMP2456]